MHRIDDHRIDDHGSCASRVRRFAALWVVLVLAATFSAGPVEAQQGRAFAFAKAGSGATMFMIDLTTNKVVANIPSDGPLQSAVTADGGVRYVVITNNNVVFAYTGGNERKVILVGAGAYGLTISLDGTKVFVFNRISNTISVIDTRDNVVVETDQAPAYHFGVNVSQVGYLTAVK